jgi:hypothetical protein
MAGPGVSLFKLWGDQFRQIVGFGRDGDVIETQIRPAAVALQTVGGRWFVAVITTFARFHRSDNELTVAECRPRWEIAATFRNASFARGLAAMSQQRMLC